MFHPLAIADLFILLMPDNTMDPQKKPYRCKYIFGVRYVRRVPKTATSQPAMIRPNLEAMPKGMPKETMDSIIRARGQNHRMNAKAQATPTEK